MLTIRLLLFGLLWIMVIDAETVGTAKPPVAATPPTVTTNTTTNTTTIAPAITTNTTTIAPAITTNTTTIAPAITTNTTTIAPAITTKSTSTPPTTTTNTITIAPAITTNTTTIAPVTTTNTTTIPPANMTNTTTIAPAITTKSTSTPPTTMTTTTTENEETVSEEDDPEQTTAALNASPKPGDRRPYELPPCNDTWSLVRREPSFCVQKELCVNQTDTTNSSCVAHMRNCTEIEYELFYCIKENITVTTTLAPKIEKESNVAWIVAAVILSIFGAALCCFVSIGGAMCTWIAAKRRMNKKKKNEKKLETPDGNSSMISKIRDDSVLSVTGLATLQDPSRMTALGSPRNDAEEKRPLLNKTSF